MMRKCDVDGRDPGTFSVAHCLEQVDELLSNSNHRNSSIINNNNNNSVVNSSTGACGKSGVTQRQNHGQQQNRHVAPSPLVSSPTPRPCKHHHHHHHHHHHRHQPRHQGQIPNAAWNSPHRGSAQAAKCIRERSDGTGHLDHMTFVEWLRYHQEEFEGVSAVLPAQADQLPSAMSETEDEQEPQHHEVQQTHVESADAVTVPKDDDLCTQVKVSEWDPIRLPCEIILHILASLDGADVVRLSCTSKSWRAFILFYQDEVFQRACLKKGWTSLPGSPSNTNPRIRHRLVPGSSNVIDWLYIFRRNTEVEHKWLKGHFNIDVTSAREANVHLPKFTAESWGTMLDANTSTRPQLQAPSNSCTGLEREHDDADESEDEGRSHNHSHISAVIATAGDSCSAPLSASMRRNEWCREWTTAAFCNVSF